MRQHHLSRNLARLLLTCCFLSLEACRAPVSVLTAGSVYRVILPAASQTTPLRPLLLTVRVTDTEGQPVDNVPVHFRIAQSGTRMAEVEPPTVLTQEGQATAVFRARAAGRVSIDITVDDHTETVSISVLGDTPRF